MLTAAELWDERAVMRPALPPRSRLFHLEPIGVGTAQVESLTGYIARLAEAHGVETSKLVTREILPLLGRANLLDSRGHGRIGFWQTLTPGINGTQALARGTVAALETLTRRSDLRNLTMGTWAEVAPSAGLLHRTAAWCPMCYEEWQQTGQIVYEPLLWAVEVVMVCPQHKCRLQRVCPHPDCRRARPVLGRRSRPGRCPRCERWLGRAPGAEPTEMDVWSELEWRKHAWVAAVVGELLVPSAHLVVPPRREQVGQALDRCREQVTGGNFSAWARTLGLDRVRLLQWHNGSHLPSLEMLVWLCHHLGTTPLRFLTDAALVVAPVVPIHSGWSEPPRRPTTPPRPFDVADTRRALEAVLAVAEQPPPSLAQVAQRLGRPATSLQHRLPELCRAISVRRLEYVQARRQRWRQQLCDEIHQAAAHVDAAGFYPSMSRVAALISKPAYLKGATDARAALRQARKELGWPA
ncbi:MAG: TniQ family protein [Gemmatimonadota bacterium]|nr:TniQ family protein [Gemmatimonadota bacterium]